MPNVEHKFCVKHKYKIYKSKLKGIEYKKLLWAAASASTQVHFEKHMAKLKELMKMLTIGPCNMIPHMAHVPFLNSYQI